MKKLFGIPLILSLMLTLGTVAIIAHGIPSAPVAESFTKAATPPDSSTVAYGAEISYTFTISAPLTETLHFYDPLDRHLAWGGFLARPEGVSFDASLHALTGTIRPSDTLAFKVRAGEGAPADLPPGSSVVSNTAYLYREGDTLGLAQPSNTVRHAVTRRAFVFMPLILRDYPPNQLPYAPSNPTPADGATDQDTPLTLQWSGGDPDGNTVTYDVYLDAGDSTPQTKVCAAVSQAQCVVNLDYATTYYWKVVATDSRDGVTEGPVWHFTMRDKPLPAWLSYLNSFRQGAELPTLEENSTWSNGCWLHARYMVKNDYIGHTEDSSKPWYTPEGALAASNSNVMVYSNIYWTDTGAIDMWMEGPFHAVGILDPHLHSTGFGSYREAIGRWQMGAALDVLRGRGALPAGQTFPIYWPANGHTMPLLSYPGSEAPDPLTSCSGYQAPSGPPIILQLGAGSVTPNVTAHSFAKGSTALEHCVFDETNYVNPNGSTQNLGRSVLGSRDAVVLMPRAPLQPDTQYTVSITANGTTYTWSFVTSGTRHATFHGVGRTR